MPTEPPDLAALLDNTTDAVVAIDDDWQVTYVNRTAREYAAVDEPVGRPLDELFPGFDASRVDAALRVASEVRDPVTVEEYVSALEAWLEVRAFPGADGGLVFYATDVTARHDAVVTLETEHALLQRVFDTSPVGIVVVEADGRIVQANERAQELLGVRKATITRRTFDSLEWEDVDADGNPIRSEDLPVGRVLATGRPVFGFEHGVHLPDGTERWLSVNAAPLRGSGGRRVVATFEDVTDHREYERRITEANDRLALLSRLLRHDVRNDLQVIIGWADVLREQIAGGESGYVDRIEHAAQDAVELTEAARDLTDFVLGDVAGGSALHPVPLQDVVAEEVEKHRELYPDADFRVDDLPAVSVRADALLGSLVGNVLSNAVQHNDQPTPAVHVSLTSDAATATVSVADNGPGIPDAVRESLFRAPGADFEETGSGIGLFLVSQLVAHYGGDIVAEPNDPRGTVFTITLPRADT